MNNVILCENVLELSYMFNVLNIKYDTYTGTGEYNHLLTYRYLKLV